MTDQDSEGFIQAHLAGSEYKQEVRLETRIPFWPQIFTSELSNLWVTNPKIFLNTFYQP